ncbi:MAG: acyl--CoA ligase [Gammaproteobacteria bacterium]|nr:acyl--CoA ligase [Gammaproteobacteria bacterium]
MTTYDDLKANFELEIPQEYNFGFDLIDKRAREADKTAFIAVDANCETATPYRFSDLSRSSNQFANWLLSLGIAKGELAFVMLPRIAQWYTVMIGCCKCGVVAMPGTNLLTAKDIAYRVQESGASIAIVNAEQAEKVDEIRASCPTLKHFIVVGERQAGWLSLEEGVDSASTELDRASLPVTKSSDLMLIYFTSGTTSLPKMVPRDHGYAYAHKITGRYWMDLSEDDVHWTLSDTGWAKAAWGVLYGPWQMGAAIVLHDAVGFDPALHLLMIGKLGVTTFCAPPTAYRMFAQMDLKKFDLSSLRHSMGAGEPLNPEVIKIWEAATGCAIYDGYGQTETINIVANYPCLPVRAGSMGKPVPGLDVSVIDDDGNTTPDDEIGHIAVRLSDPAPPGLFDGYWQAPEASERVFRNGWYYTGDTATRDADGYFWFVGRSDDIISSAGYRISPFEVESSLLEHPAVAESAVVGIPDEIRGQLVKAFIVLSEGHTPSDQLRQDIQDFVKAHTAPYKYPREVEFRTELPKTISGKIRRVELRDDA